MHEEWTTTALIDPEIRSHELTARVRWFINMRWLAVLACFGATVIAALRILPAALNPLYFGITSGLLAAVNFGYTLVARSLSKRETLPGQVQVFIAVQMIGDFIALFILTYACGSIETPILTLFLVHIILATLFFNRSRSFLVIMAAWLFASAPLVFEWAGLLPVLSIFQSDFKDIVTNSNLITGAFVIGIGGAFFVCWYLVGVISRSLKIREKQLEHAHKMLIEIDREKTQATLRATHELKAPFAAIKSYVYTLREGYCGVLPEKAESVVDRIGKRCDQLTEKITDIIHLSNLRTLIVTKTNFSPVDLVELISEIAREGALLGEPRGVLVDNRLLGLDSTYVHGSRPHLVTLFSNLIQNAVRYSHDRGKVEVSMERKGRQACVSIRDYGIGIPKENIERIFDEHFRSNNAVAHNPNGTGLGLSIVQEIARLHGTAVLVESELKKGAQFSVCFDVDAAENRRDHYG